MKLERLSWWRRTLLPVVDRYFCAFLTTLSPSRQLRRTLEASSSCYKKSLPPYCLSFVSCSSLIQSSSRIRASLQPLHWFDAWQWLCEDWIVRCLYMFAFAFILIWRWDLAKVLNTSAVEKFFVIYLLWFAPRKWWSVSILSMHLYSPDFISSSLADKILTLD